MNVRTAGGSGGGGGAGAQLAVVVVVVTAVAAAAKEREAEVAGLGEAHHEIVGIRVVEINVCRNLAVVEYVGGLTHRHISVVELQIELRAEGPDHACDQLIRKSNIIFTNAADCIIVVWIEFAIVPAT
jgi:hypothetical protein